LLCGGGNFYSQKNGEKYMTALDLAEKFDEVKKTHLDFIEWASTYGVKISSGVCLRHLGRYKNEKPRKISEGFRLAYLLYFYSLRGD